jgi:serine/threonine protein kinase
MSNKYKVAPPIATVVNGHTFTVDKRYVLTDSKILGKGSFGVVCTAYDSVRKIDLAIKRIRPYANDEWDARHCLREIRLLKLLGPHPNIITLYELSLFEEKTELYMTMEVMDCDLHRVIQSKQPLSEKHHKCFIKQMLEGIKAMHAIGVFHRDLKPGNILVSKDCQLRITDFGLARFMDDSTRKGANQENPMTEYVVTRWYRCPEILLSPNKPYSEAIDLWSIGCILAELIKRKPLFPGKSHANQVQLIFEVMGYNNARELGFPVSVEASSFLDKRCRYRKQPLQKVMPGVSNDAAELLEALLSVSPMSRPSAEAALFFPFLMDDCEVLHDYTKTYLARPSKEFFDFETEKQTVPYLKNMIEKEVTSSLASQYQFAESQALSMPTSESLHNVGGTDAISAMAKKNAVFADSGNPEEKAVFAAYNAAQYAQQQQIKNNNDAYRRLSNAESIVQSVHTSRVAHSHDEQDHSQHHTEGPASQLQTQRADRRAVASEKQGNTAGGGKRENNPFRRQEAADNEKVKGVVRVPSFRDKSQSPFDSVPTTSTEKEMMTQQGNESALSVSDADALPMPASSSSYQPVSAVGHEQHSAHAMTKSASQQDPIARPQGGHSIVPGFSDNILMAVREEAAIVTRDGSGKRSPRQSSDSSKSPRPSPKKMQEILQKDLNNKKRFLQQGLQKQQQPQDEVAPEQAEGGSQAGNSLYMDRDEYYRRQGQEQAVRANTTTNAGEKIILAANTRSQTSGSDKRQVTSGIGRTQYQYANQPAGKATGQGAYQTSVTSLRTNSSSRGVAAALSSGDSTDSDATAGDLTVTGASKAEKPRAVSASLISQLQNTYQNISGKIAKKKGVPSVGGQPVQLGTNMHLRSGNSSTMMMNSGSNVLLNNPAQRPASEEFP